MTHKLLSLLSKDLRAIVLTFTFFGMMLGPVRAADFLTVADKNRSVANKEAMLIVVLDLKPNAPSLKRAGAGAPNLIVATATHYAEEYLATKEFRAIPKAVVYLISVESMDECDRANFSGMKRYGTLTFKRKGADLILTKNKLKFEQ